MLVLLFLPVIKLIFCFFFNQDRHQRHVVKRGDCSHLLGGPVTRCLTRSYSSVPCRCSHLVRLFHRAGRTFPFRKGEISICARNCAGLRTLLHRLRGTGRRVRVRCCVFRSSTVNHLIESMLVRGTSRKIRIEMVCSSIKY